MDWWKRYPIYQIYPRSFKDSNGNGVGDIKGILEKLDYFQWLGIKVLWLSPIGRSPMKDFGYDIADYRDVDPLFGTMNDFKELVSALHEKGMYLIMDFVPNHTSDQHQWFLASKAGEERYLDYYIWRDPIFDAETKERRPPNDVVSVFGGPAWTWCEERQKYYLHHFLPEQPDLNYKNPLVRAEMTSILKYWVDLGVDGFRVDAIAFLGKDEEHTKLPSKNDKDNPKCETEDKCSRCETFEVAGTSPESYEILSEWVRFLRENYQTVTSDGDKNEPDAGHRHVFLCAEVYSDLDSVLRYYDAGADFPFNFSLVNWSKKSTAHDLRRWVNEWMKRMPYEQKTTTKSKRKLEVNGDQPAGRWPNWVAGNHDQPRPASRLGGSVYANVINALLLTLPGTATCYQGDELGMVDVPVTYEECQDPYGKRFGPEHYTKFTRDPCRSPIIWNAALKNGGFTSEEARPWLPLSKDKAYFAVDRQQNDPDSHLSFFRRLLRLRDAEPTLHQFGHNIRLFAENDEDLFVFERYAPDGHVGSGFLVILNVGHGPEDEYREIDLSKEIDKQALIIIASCSKDERGYEEGETIDLAHVRMKPAEVLIAQLVVAGSPKRQKRQ